MKHVLAIFLVFAALNSRAEQSPRGIDPAVAPNSVKKVADSQVLSKADVMPEPITDFSTYVMHNVIYPKSARDSNVQGKVTVKFIVNEDGHISDITVMDGGVQKDIDAEVVRLIKRMPAWKPGMQDGKPVKVYVTKKVRFVLD